MNTSTHSDSQSTDNRRVRNVRLLRRSTLAVAVAFAVAGVAAIAKPTPTLPDASPLVIEQSAVQFPAARHTQVPSGLRAGDDLHVAVLGQEDQRQEDHHRCQCRGDREISRDRKP